MPGLGLNFAAVDLFPHACMRTIIFAAVFTNFAATLARQPSAASLAPRLNYHYIHEIFAKKLEREFLQFPHCVSLTEKIFRENNSLVAAVNPLISRNFCSKMVREKFCIFYTDTLECGKMKTLISPKNVS